MNDFCLTGLRYIAAGEYMIIRSVMMKTICLLFSFEEIFLGAYNYIDEC